MTKERILRALQRQFQKGNISLNDYTTINREQNRLAMYDELTRAFKKEGDSWKRAQKRADEIMEN